MGAEAKLSYKLDTKSLDRLIGKLRKTEDQAGLTEKEINEIERSLKDVDKKGGRNLDNLNKKMDGIVKIGRNIGSTIIAAFAVDRLIDFQKRIIDITREFQTQKAVLENALGSKGAANLFFANIQREAAKTNFSVLELTKGLTKMLSNGIQPNAKELRAFIDLTNNAGKGFDQWAEAVNDAVNGEFERLKEFFIKASKNGDELTFTFKEQQFTVDNNAESIKNLLVQLGQMEGVAGATDKISKQLGGSISNLGDSWERLFSIIGEAESGPLQSITKTLTNIVNQVGDLLETTASFETRLASAELEKLKEQFGNLKTEDDYKNKIEELKQKNTELLESFDSLQVAQHAHEEAASSGLNMLDAFNLVTTDAEKSMADLDSQLQKARVEFEANQGAVAFLEQQLKSLNKQTDKGKKSWDDYTISIGFTHDEFAEFLNTLKKEDFKTLDQLTNEWLNTLEEAPEVIKEQKDAIEETMKVAEDYLAWKKAADEAQLEHDHEVASAGIDLALTTANSLVDIFQARNERELGILAAREDRELALVGDNEARKLQIRGRFDQEEEKLRKKQAKRDKALFAFEKLGAIGQIIIQTRLAVAKAFASSPLTAGEPWASIARVNGALGIATVAAQSIPALALKDGMYNIQGPGTETSDSIPIWGSKGETMVSARPSKRFGWMLKPMVEDKNFNESKLARLVMEHVPYELRGNLFEAGNQKQIGIDEDKLAYKIVKPIVRGLRDHGGAKVYVNGRRRDGYGEYLDEQWGVQVS
ncbi:MAG: hypothetical protein RJQ09_21230 [Cyclobacteriaceae bacterium]